jgi:proteasome lid subunit RPN8/RPN11
VVRHAEAGYPNEVCGLVIGRPGAPETLAVRAVRNVADDERPTDAGGRPRDARSAYLMDPRDQIRVLRDADERGWEVVCIYHSHPDHDASFSRMDRDRALDHAARPLWPGTAYLIVSVRGGRACEACWVRWHEGDFRARPVRLPPPA